MMKNKKASETSIKPVLELILVVLVIIVVIWGLYKWGIIDYFKGLPEFNETEYGKKIIAEQEAVPEKEKERDYGERYPIVRLHYSGFWNKDDLFAFRWNSNISKMQVVMNIGIGLSSEMSGKWYLSPDSSGAFRDQKGLYPYEKEDVIKIMKAKSEDEMIGKIAEALQKEDIYVEFPEYNKDAVSRFPELEKFEKLNAEQIKQKLHEIYAWYYKNEE